MLKPFLFVFKKLEGKKASHAVGLELRELSVPEVMAMASPSHTVGSE